MGIEPHADELLRETDLFRSLEHGVQDELASRVMYRAFDVGERLIEAGRPGRALLILLRGGAEVYAREGGSRLRVAALEAGEIFGELTFFTPDAPRTADVVGTSPGVVAVISFELYQELARRSPAAGTAIEKAVLSTLASRLEETNRTMAQLMDRYRSSGMGSALEWLRGLLGSRR